jgi:hypothetical protein
MKKHLILFIALGTFMFSCSSDEKPTPIAKYTIIFSAGDGGSVSTTGGEYEKGQTLTVTATAQGEYLFTGWSDGITDATRTITIDATKTITANFEKKKYPLKVNIEGEGEVLQEIVKAGKTTDYSSGTMVKLTAVPAEGWGFVGWYGAIVSSESIIQITVNESKQLSAVFKETEPPKIKLTTIVPIGGNSWVTNDLAKNNQLISNGGLHNWMDLKDVIRTYIYVNTVGKLGLGLTIKVPSGRSKIKVTVAGKSKEIDVSNTEYKEIYVGDFEVTSKGYQHIEIQGISKTGSFIGDINTIKIGGDSAEKVEFIKKEENFYFGRRGPSVHLFYEKPAGKNIKWFYNEITVPDGEDVIGSYYMANGFTYGYFGIQVNSETERRVLFSVWSAFDTQNPAEIPKEYTVEMLGKGSGVTVGEFGGEGSGGQSYLVYNWKPATTYKFLLKGESNISNSIDYTAYFYAPEVDEWKLIASFRRPKSVELNVNNMYSFLENFDTKTGYIERKVNFTNQWAYDTNGTWNELTRAKYTADATARERVRLDYDGGVSGNTFFLRNCGFFSDNTDFDVFFSRTANGVAPAINFSELEVPKK